jgi:hypothetical protein
MPVETSVLPARIVTLLRSSQAAELAAAGPQRRVAWRTTRQLLGAVIEAGYPASVVARCLNISAGEVRARATADGWLAVSTIAELTGFSADVFADWHETGLMPTCRLGPGEEPHYPAVELIDVLASVRLNPTVSRRRLRRAVRRSAD